MPAKSALPASRPPLARMLDIHEILQDGIPTNCTKLAKQLEVSTKTIMRDLAFMRDQFDLPVEYNPQTYAWRYAYPVKNFPMVRVSEGELFALLVARKALEQYKGTPYHSQLAQTFDKLSAGLHQQVSFSPTGGLSGVSFHHSGLGTTDTKVYERLSRAVSKGLEVEFDYKKPETETTERRHVQPYHLANRENSWYLVGYDSSRHELRHFSVMRTHNVVVLTKKFVRPADFSSEKHFGKSFGAFVGSGDHKVVIRFRAEAAHKVKERFWHESQETRELADGRLEFTVHLGSLDEIQRWILGWGPQVEVVAPRELIASVKACAVAVAKLY